MISIAVSKMGMTELIFVDPGMKVNGEYYRDVSLSQQLAIKHVAGDTFVYQQDSVPSHHAMIPLILTSTARNAGLPWS